MTNKKPMTNKEAIEILDHYFDGGCTDFVWDAYQLAIKALEAQDDKDTNVPNNDAISRQAVLSLEKEIYVKEADFRHRSIDPVDVMELPSVTPDIIACGDCKHWICHDRRCGYWNHGVKPLEWCCHAERRTDERTD